MADHVHPAVDFKSAVLPLPDGQKPYDDVDMPRDIQAIMWHYGVQKPEVLACVAEGYGSKADFQFADPYATDAESKFMFKAIADRIKGKLPLRKLKGAISRILSADPLAAIAPPEKRKRDASPAKNDEAPAADAAGASDVSKSSKTATSKSSKKKLKNDSSDSSSSDDSSDSGESGDDGLDDSKESSSKASSSKSKSLDALFNNVANQVRFFDIPVSHIVYLVAYGRSCFQAIAYI